jgi:hypothetical protein
VVSFAEREASYSSVWEPRDLAFHGRMFVTIGAPLVDHDLAWTSRQAAQPVTLLRGRSVWLRRAGARICRNEGIAYLDTFPAPGILIRD